MLADPTLGAELVRSYESGLTMCIRGCNVEEYANGITKIQVFKGWSGCDPKYWIFRTDFSDGLIDEDGNGLDDRDPLNDCGYTDLNFNAVIDGAPSYPSMIDESETARYTLCQHGVVNGTYICKQKECSDFLDWMRTVRIR